MAKRAGTGSRGPRAKTAAKGKRQGTGGRRRARKPRKERRADPRRAVDLLVNRFLDGYPTLCRAVDISRSGMRLRPIGGPAASAGRAMGLQFQLPGTTEVLTASGEPVSGAGELGVRFTRVPTGTATVLARFLARG